MAMPYNVVKTATGYQVQTMHKGKFANIKGMEFENATEAYQKFAELIEEDYVKRVPENIRRQNSIKAAEMIRKFGENK